MGLYVNRKGKQRKNANSQQAAEQQPDRENEDEKVNQTNEDVTTSPSSSHTIIMGEHGVIGEAYVHPLASVAFNFAHRMNKQFIPRRRIVFCGIFIWTFLLWLVLVAKMYEEDSSFSSTFSYYTNITFAIQAIFYTLYILSYFEKAESRRFERILVVYFLLPVYAQIYLVALLVMFVLYDAPDLVTAEMKSLGGEYDDNLVLLGDRLFHVLPAFVMSTFLFGVWPDFVDLCSSCFSFLMLPLKESVVTITYKYWQDELDRKAHSQKPASQTSKSRSKISINQEYPNTIPVDDEWFFKFLKNRKLPILLGLTDVENTTLGFSDIVDREMVCRDYHLKVECLQGISPFIQSDEQMYHEDINDDDESEDDSTILPFSNRKRKVEVTETGEPYKPKTPPSAFVLEKNISFSPIPVEKVVETSVVSEETSNIEATSSSNRWFSYWLGEFYPIFTPANKRMEFVIIQILMSACPFLFYSLIINIHDKYGVEEKYTSWIMILAVFGISMALVLVPLYLLFLSSLPSYAVTKRVAEKNFLKNINKKSYAETSIDLYKHIDPFGGKDITTISIDVEPPMPN